MDLFFFTDKIQLFSSALQLNQAYELKCISLNMNAAVFHLSANCFMINKHGLTFFVLRICYQRCVSPVGGPQRFVLYFGLWINDEIVTVLHIQSTSRDLLSFSHYVALRFYSHGTYRRNLLFKIISCTGVTFRHNGLSSICTRQFQSCSLLCMGTFSYTSNGPLHQCHSPFLKSPPSTMIRLQNIYSTLSGFPKRMSRQFKLIDVSRAV